MLSNFSRVSLPLVLSPLFQDLSSCSHIPLLHRCPASSSSLPLFHDLSSYSRYPTLWVCPASSSLSSHCSMVSPPPFRLYCSTVHMGSSPPVPNPLFYSLSSYWWNPTLQWSLLPNPLFYSLSYYWWNPLFNGLSFFNYHPLFHSLCTFSPHHPVQRSVLNQLPSLIFHGVQPIVPSNNYLVYPPPPFLRFHDLFLPYQVLILLLKRLSSSSSHRTIPWFPSSSSSHPAVQWYLLL